MWTTKYADVADDAISLFSHSLQGERQSNLCAVKGNMVCWMIPHLLLSGPAPA